jgi:hypothetical protein
MKKKQEKAAPVIKITRDSKKSQPKNTLEEQKRKLINAIRTLLNDYPGLHPLANDFFYQSTLTILKRVHLELLRLDGSQMEKEKKIRERLEKGKKIASAPLRALKKSQPRKIQGQEEFELKKTQTRKSKNQEELEILFIP